MAIDPFNDLVVVKRMQELQQRKYRQGHRNTTDKQGNPAYALTDEDKISCLDQATQAKVRTNMQRLRMLEEYADPFTFSVGTGEFPPKYIVNITHPSWGHSRRSDSVSLVDQMPNPEVWFKQKIDEMKVELGYSQFGKTRETLQSKIEQKNKQGYSVTDKHSKTPAVPPHCPEHGNELVRGPEPGTLVCTVVGCKKVARKKTAAKKQEEDTLKVADILASSPQVQAVIADPKPPVVEQIQFAPRDSPVTLRLDGERAYLVQEIPGYGFAYIDITGCAPDFSVFQSGPTSPIDSELRLSAVRPWQ